MLIIFGSRGREVNEKTGQFNCPSCCTQQNIKTDEKQQQYTQVKVARYFTLFFIPIFSFQTLGRYIRCNHCHSEYNENVLKYVPPTLEEEIGKDVEQELKSGTPISMMINKLKTQGLDEQQATKLVDQIVSGNIVTCHHCKKEFLKGVEKCPLCEGYLSN
ncbi:MULTISPECIES: zinc-ribbon domain-containing protein [unclassified Gilliamella]|uniref:zinc-ribbon domain-containing protein n=1 Tax=unclassified Gilliamella TaxID=2685620 RepID=UPI00226A1714|nr:MULTISPECIES: zinc-ribbon domain-containing protein [unclassified Gilliamella]MCX8574390.1 zinc-ribbon domain-containing protein [Gilliamella sp. B3831]MCX8576621.1 zinc-ribbon domain-containing protein [Gilliamella sp. B3815]MCX8590809.1 zinc-ribbon domain-containing protein [Gilliamella sp. B3812]MCX8603492.1 zinc-ribbon domain-containing protein [Gilliamella sp. B3823]MCX8605884.1 zinc-ribbon domain-containing protein [Gilliamella sp. B3825]